MWVPNVSDLAYCTLACVVNVRLTREMDINVSMDNETVEGRVSVTEKKRVVHVPVMKVSFTVVRSFTGWGSRYGVQHSQYTETRPNRT